MSEDEFLRDPRSARLDGGERDVRPIISRARSGLPAWFWVGLAVLAGLALFGMLDARRRSAAAPAVFAPVSDRAAGAAPPPLYIPPPPLGPEPYLQPPTSFAASPSPPASTARPRYDQNPYPPSGNRYQPPLAREPYVPAPNIPGMIPAPPNPLRQRGDGGKEAALETDTGAPAPSPSRVRASVVANRATTVLQGTLIPAVLETGFDSSRPGFARALVQRDIKGFDGSRVLIPRGSRLIGTYSSEAGPAQKRAMIAWERLVRPDGVTIAIGSPASDPVGRGGVRADVNGHFFERFSGAILQSTLDVGVNLASRSAGSPVIVALPGSLQGATSSVTRSRDIPPTLSVRPGTSISIFVARDLDFTDVEKSP